MNLKSMIPAYIGLNLFCSAILFFMLLEGYLAYGAVLAFNEASKIILVIILASISLTLFGVLLTYLTPEKYIDEMNKSYQDSSVLEIISFMLLAALFEELLFRGIIQNVLFIIVDHRWLAILLTSFLFVAFHVQYYKKPLMLLNITVPSLVFGWCYFYTDNLLVPIIVHFILNVSMTLLFKFNKITLKA
ncbi:type II CAAX endopeptidase family protein [uncultured Psychrobacillus sp.]|uniref:CPBP family intramembrane glutamic endopeptidase n=1 Tax=uncultured Psychrobacillus sp. TaxID=1551585 RepID=UPI00262D2C9D|nr:type II CAAX endopeptidase family protein [uncultured Psychrobacillus sp.]